MPRWTVNLNRLLQGPGERTDILWAFCEWLVILKVLSSQERAQSLKKHIWSKLSLPFFELFSLAYMPGLVKYHLNSLWVDFFFFLPLSGINVIISSSRKVTATIPSLAPITLVVNCQRSYPHRPVVLPGTTGTVLTQVTLFCRCFLSVTRVRLSTEMMLFP